MSATVEKFLANFGEVLNKAPESLRRAMMEGTQELALKATLRAGMVAERPTFPPAEADLVGTYNGSRDMLRDAKIDVRFSGTVHDALVQVAEIITSAVKRDLITADSDTQLRTGAWLDVIEGHALIASGLASLQVQGNGKPNA